MADQVNTSGVGATCVESSNTTILDMKWRVAIFCGQDNPADPQEWPRFIWASMYKSTPPPEGGDYFALPIRNNWVPLLSPAILLRVHKLVGPTIRIVVRDGVRTKLLAVSLSEHGDPTCILQLHHLAGTWEDLQAWCRHMLGDGGGRPLDEFLRERLIHEVASNLSQSGFWSMEWWRLSAM